MYKVRKRDGSLTRFNIQKITRAITLAFEACGKQTDESIIELIAIRVSREFEGAMKDGVIEVEKIQDSVEKVLANSGYYDVAKEYILYRKQHENIRILSSSNEGFAALLQEYVMRKYQQGGLEHSIGGVLLASSFMMNEHYWLNSVYSRNIREMIQKEVLTICDLNMLTPNQVVLNPFEMFLGVRKLHDVTYAPPKHFDSFLQQLNTLFALLQNEWQDEIGLVHFDTYSSGYVYVDQLDEGQVKQALQSFIHQLNVPMLMSSKMQKIRLMFDEQHQDHLIQIGQQQLEQTYAGLTHHKWMVIEQFLDILIAKDAAGANFQVPILDFHLEGVLHYPKSLQHKIYQCVQMGYPLRFHQNALASSILGKMQLDLAKIAQEHISMDRFLEDIQQMVIHIEQAFTMKEHTIDVFFQHGLYPNSALYFSTLKQLEWLVNLQGIEEVSKKWQINPQEVFKKIRKMSKKIQWDVQPDRQINGEHDFPQLLQKVTLYQANHLPLTIHLQDVLNSELSFMAWLAKYQQFICLGVIQIER